MTVRNRDAMFNPASISVIDVPPADSAADWATAPAPSLAVIRAPAKDWTAIVARLGARGTRAVILAGEAIGDPRAEQASDIRRRHLHAALAAARPNLVRLLGPGDAGILTPRIGLHAGLSGRIGGDPEKGLRPAIAGRIAGVSQSDYAARRAITFAAARRLGFSSVVSLGDEADVDGGDVLDYLASDAQTVGVMLAIDHVKSARKFMSAARACVRNKPVVVWCEPNDGEDRLAYDAAIERAGFVRVASLDALLDALASLESPQVFSSTLIAQYGIARERLAQTPQSLPQHHVDLQRALALTDTLVPTESGAGISQLCTDDALRLLQCFGIAAAPGTAAGLRDEAPRAATVSVTMTDDLTFGPFVVIRALSGSTASALLPLNAALAREALRHLPEVIGWTAPDMTALVDMLASVSLLLCSIERIVAFSATVVVSDMQAALRGVTISIGGQGARRPLAIRPYPVELEEHMNWDARDLTIRPIRPEDERAHAEFFRALTPEDVRLRFFGAMRRPDHTQLARYVQIDYDREMALIACTEENGATVTHGVVRAVADPDNETAEFAVTVRSGEKGHHLGRLLMARIIAYCRARGTGVLIGEVLRDNTRMLALARVCGFEMKPSEDSGVVAMRLPLKAAHVESNHPTEAS